MRFKDGFFTASQGVGSTAEFKLDGGAYAMDATSASWGGGTATLQRLGPNGSSWITADTAAVITAANGTTGAMALPGGTYRVTVATATGVAIQVSRVPGE